MPTIPETLYTIFVGLFEGDCAKVSVTTLEKVIPKGYVVVVMGVPRRLLADVIKMARYKQAVTDAIRPKHLEVSVYAENHNMRFIRFEITEIKGR